MLPSAGVGYGRSGNKSRLLFDWKFRMAFDPSYGDGWSYNWDFAETSTTSPTPRDYYSTLYLLVNHTDDPIQDFQNFIQQLNEKQFTKDDTKLTVELTPTIEDKMHVVLKQKGEVQLTGLLSNFKGADMLDGNVGNYAQLLSTTGQGMMLIRTMAAATTHGYSAIIDHTLVEFDIGDGGSSSTYKLQTVTGLSPKYNPGKVNLGKGLATRFTILDKKEGTDVARCHLSYIDGSFDPSIGPTIEMMAVHEKYRGKNLAPLLWFWVQQFVQDNFTLECMNKEAPVHHIMIKATQLNNAIVDNRGDELITDKDFFYTYAGFSVRRQKGDGAAMAANRPLDEEAVCYLPLKERNKNQTTEESILTPHLTDTDKWWDKSKAGARTCHVCQKFQKGCQRCMQCRVAFYCSKACQKRDWKVGCHKEWCGKTKEQVVEILVQQGVLRKMEDGTYNEVHD